MIGKLVNQDSVKCYEEIIPYESATDCTDFTNSVNHGFEVQIARRACSRRFGRHALRAASDSRVKPAAKNYSTTGTCNDFFSSSPRVSRITATSIKAPPTIVIGCRRSWKSSPASRTVTTGSSVESMEALVGPIRSKPARNVATGITVATSTMPAIPSQPTFVEGKCTPLTAVIDP